MNERPLQRARRGMGERLGECPQDREVGGPLEIEHPSHLFGLVIMVESNFLERFQELTAARVNPMWLAHECHDHVAIGRLVENHLGMTGRNNLAALFACGIGEDLVDLALAQNLQVRVRFVEKNDRAWVHGKVGEQQQRLLQPASGRRDVEMSASMVPIGHRHLAAFRDV